MQDDDSRKNLSVRVSVLEGKIAMIAFFKTCLLVLVIPLIFWFSLVVIPAVALQFNFSVRADINEGKGPLTEDRSFVCIDNRFFQGSHDPYSCTFKRFVKDIWFPIAFLISVIPYLVIFLFENPIFFMPPCFVFIILCVGMYWWGLRKFKKLHNKIM